MTFAATIRRMKRRNRCPMWTKTQNRLLTLALICCGVGMPLQAQNGEAPPARLPDANNIQNQRLNRMPDQRTRPEAYGIPPMAPTTNPAPATAPSPSTQPEAAQASIGPSVSVAETPSRRATVSYTNGKLAVVATNSSLNQILRDISRTAGITITGGVADERVFGNYGPGTPAVVLNDLLDGTGSNMLYVQGVGNRKSELVLTNRTGGPTPPNPNAARSDMADDDQAAQPAPPPPPPDAPSSSQPSAVQGPPPPDNVAPAPATTNSSSGDSSSDQSNGGAKTPQQIFDELMKLRQQNQQKQ